jgi:hypothetical protein
MGPEEEPPMREFRLGVQGRGSKNVTAKRPAFDSISKAVEYARRENPVREREGKLPFEYVCEFSLGKSHRKVENHPISSLLEQDADGFRPMAETKVSLGRSAYEAAKEVVKTADPIPAGRAEVRLAKTLESEAESQGITFEGYRDASEVVHVNVWRVVDGRLVSKALNPRLDEVNWSPTGYEYGYSGSGPSQLAYAMLRELGFDKETAQVSYFGVRDVLLARLGREIWKWEITEAIIRSTIEKFLGAMRKF